MALLDKTSSWLARSAFVCACMVLAGCHQDYYIPGYGFASQQEQVYDDTVVLDEADPVIAPLLSPQPSYAEEVLSSEEMLEEEFTNQALLDAGCPAGRPVMDANDEVICLQVTADAGQHCTDSNQCSVGCLIANPEETSGICYPETPFLGCMLVLKDNKAVYLCD